MVDNIAHDGQYRLIDVEIDVDRCVDKGLLIMIDATQ